MGSLNENSKLYIALMGTPNRLMDLSIKESSQFDYHNFVGAIIRKGMTVIIKKENLRK